MKHNAERMAQIREDEGRALSAIENLKAEHGRITADKKDNEKEVVSDVPIMKYALSLYTLISNISWDYNSENVKGIITSPSGEQPTKAFDIDPSELTTFELTNKLWDMM